MGYEAKTNELYLKYAQLYAAAYQLYMAGDWHCPELFTIESAELWEKLRDALGLELSTATPAGVEATCNCCLIPGEHARHGWSNEEQPPHKCICPNSYTGEPDCPIHGYKATARL